MNNNTAVVTGGAVSGFGGGGEVNLINCCLAQNRARWGTAVLGWEVNIVNSIIWGDVGTGLIYNNQATISYSIVEGGYPGVGNIDSNPMFVNESEQDYRLSFGSPAIDAGDNVMVPGSVATDANHEPRFVDDPYAADTGNPDGTNAMIDIGPYEFQGVKLPIVVSPETMLVVNGEHVGGSADNLSESDNVDLVLARSNSDIFSRTGFEIKGVSPTQTPTRLDLTLEASVFARSTVTQRILLYDYVAGAFEELDSRNARRFSDQVVVATPTGDLSRFVEPGTGAIEARIEFSSANRRQQFSSSIDQTIWSIE